MYRLIDGWYNNGVPRALWLEVGEALWLCPLKLLRGQPFARRP
jgi:hypothetical protein